MFSPLCQALDRFFEDSGKILDEGIAHSPTLDLLTAGQPLPVDVYESATEYIVDAALPGIPIMAMTISATPQLITLHAEWKRGVRASEQPGRYVRHERFEGEMQRHIPLSFPIDPSRISSSYANGVLTLRVPKIAARSGRAATYDDGSVAI
jgi:HSP20 family protein